jgi:hypothetical protein
MTWGFRKEMSRLHVGVFIVQLLLVLHLPMSSAQLDLGICVNNVKLADMNRDGFLDMGEYLDLIELYDFTCDINATELSSKQLDVFMQLSNCPCESDPFASSSCCTPEASTIDVQAAVKGLGSLTLLEQVGLNLLCVHASILTRDIVCSDSRSPTTVPSQGPLEEPSEEPSQQPASGVSQSPTKATTGSPGLPPTGGLEIPTAPPVSSPPITGPTDLPSLPLTVDKPTLSPILQTDSPVLPPTTGLEIPTSTPVVSPAVPLPTLPVSAPTNLPTLSWTVDEPSRSPTRSPTLPTALFSACVQDLKASDVNKDQQLTIDEYTVFFRKLADCTGISEGNSLVVGAFFAVQCFSSSYQNILACISLSMNISAAYVPTQQQTFNQASRVKMICDVSTSFLRNLQDCVDVPTPAPVQVPVVAPEPTPVALPTTLQPVPSPLTLVPTTKPSTAPSIIRDEPKTPSPTASPITSSNGDVEFLACTTNLVAADIDSDALLSQDQYLTFVRQQSACDTITALSSAQEGVFTFFAEKCLNATNADPNCALPRNLRVSIDGAATADNLRTVAQRQNLKSLCIDTKNVLSNTCTQAPAIVASPLSSPSTGAPNAAPVLVAPITPTQAGSNQPQPSSTTSNPVRVVPGVPVTLAPTTLSGPQTESGTSSPQAPISGPVSGSGVTPQPATDISPSGPVVTSAVTPVAGVESPVAVPSTGLPMPAPINGEALPEDCRIAMTESDRDQDSFLNQEEFLQFIQQYSQYNLITMLSDDQNTVFQTLACACLNVGEPDCCLPGNAKVSINGNSADSYFDANVCSLASATFDEECVASPTMSPINPVDLDQCALDLVYTDADKNGFLTKDEYLQFIRKYGQDDSATSLDLGQQSVFQTISCECVKYGATFECCLPGNATLNISGADISNLNRTSDQIATLSKICLSADGLTARECSTPLVATPPIDCADELVASDVNSDGYLNMDEYLLFFRKRFIDCADIEWLSFSQRVSFNVLACSCLLKPGAQLECCFPDNARVDISGANLSDLDRTTEQIHTLSSLCKASNATAKIGCRASIPAVEPGSDIATQITTVNVVELNEAVASGSRRNYYQYYLGGGLVLWSMLSKSILHCL